MIKILLAFLLSFTVFTSQADELKEPPKKEPVKIALSWTCSCDKSLKFELSVKLNKVDIQNPMVNLYDFTNRWEGLYLTMTKKF